MTDIDTSRVMLWQYDQALTFIDFLQSREDVANDCVARSWDAYYDDVFCLETCNSFGLWVWGNILGIPRPAYAVSGTKTPISDDAYRRVLRSRLFMMNAAPTIPNLTKFFAMLLDCGANATNQRNRHKRVYIVDNLNMTYTVVMNWVADEETQVIIQLPSVNIHPTGVRCYFNLTGDDAYIGFDGFYASAASNRKGLTTADKTIWTYWDVGSGLKVCPSEPYYYVNEETGEAIELEYDLFSNSYYYIDDATDEEKVCGKPVEESGTTVYRPISAHQIGSETVFAVLAPEVSYWEYDNTIPAGPYYKSSACASTDELAYDDEKNEYYDASTNLVYGRWVESDSGYVCRDIYAKVGGVAVKLEPTDDCVWTIPSDSGEYDIVINQPYDEGRHLLYRVRTQEGAKWYYPATSGSTEMQIVIGQSLSNFNNSNFQN